MPERDLSEYFAGRIKGNVQGAIAPSVADALTSFCEQEPEFKDAILDSGKTFQDCLDSVAEGVTRSLSDIEAYRRAVKFYFSTATVSFVMTIDLCGDNGAEKPPITMTKNTSEDKPQSKSLSVSLDDLLDF